MQQALEALIWTTGSDDFGDGGKAREGALKLLFPSIAALRERLAQPEQEPVKFKCTVIDDANPNGVPLSQWECQSEQEPFCYHDGCNIVGKEFADHSDVFPLYTAPQPRQWQGLTDEEIKAMPQWFPSHGTAAVLPLIRAIEAKLKEKNHG